MTEPAVAMWLLAFSITYVIEAAIAIPMLARAEPSLARRAALVFFANLATHPAVWFIVPRLGLSDTIAVPIEEAWAFGLEALFYPLALRQLTWSRGVTVSLTANVASFAFGIVLHALRVI